MSTTSKLFVSGGLLRVLQLAITVLVAFFLMPFVVHHLGDRWYGVWVIVGGLMGYYGLLDFGISSATNRYISIHLGNNDYEEVNTVLTNAIFIYLIVGILSVLVSITLVACAKYFVEIPGDVEKLRIVLLIMGVDLAISFSLKAYLAILNSKIRYDIISYVNIGQILVRTALIFYFIGHGYSIISLAIITLFVNSFGYFLFYFLAKRIIPTLKVEFFRVSKPTIIEFLSFGKKTFIIQIGDLIRFKLDIMVIAFFIGSAYVTHYNIALQLHEYSGQLAASLIFGSLPIFAKYYAQKDYDNLREKFLLLTRYSLLISITISGVAMILAAPFIARWMGKSYLSAFIPFLILRVFSFLGIGQNPSIQIMYATGTHGFYAKITIIEAFFNLILSLILVRYYGMIGVALGTVIPFFFIKLFVMPPYVCRQLKLSVSKYYYEMGWLVFFAVLGHVPYYFLVSTASIDSYQGMFASGLLYYVVYGYCLLRFLLPSGDRNYLKIAMPVLRKIL